MCVTAERWGRVGRRLGSAAGFGSRTGQLGDTGSGRRVSPLTDGPAKPRSSVRGSAGAAARHVQLSRGLAAALTTAGPRRRRVSDSRPAPTPELAHTEHVFSQTAHPLTDSSPRQQARFLTDSSPRRRARFLTDLARSWRWRSRKSSSQQSHSWTGQHERH